MEVRNLGQRLVANLILDNDDNEDNNDDYNDFNDDNEPARNSKVLIKVVTSAADDDG